MPLITGEEDETLIYEAKAKLFRFLDQQWKERGIGQIKILRHKENKQVSGTYGRGSFEITLVCQPLGAGEPYIR